MTQARNVLLKSLQLPTTTADNDPKLRELNPPWRQQFLAKAKELLIEEEVRRRKSVSSARLSHKRPLTLLSTRAVKMNLANEGLEAKKKEDEVNAKKRKVEDDAQWEGPSSSSLLAYAS